jgi:hypothetical protein
MVSTLRLPDFSRDLMQSPYRLAKTPGSDRRSAISRKMTVQPKTYERRSVPFPAVLADELAAFMVGKDRDALVFTDQRGNRCAQLQLASTGISIRGPILPGGPRNSPDHYPTRVTAQGSQLFE